MAIEYSIGDFDVSRKPVHTTVCDANSCCDNTVADSNKVGINDNLALMLNGTEILATLEYGLQTMISVTHNYYFCTAVCFCKKKARTRNGRLDTIDNANVDKLSLFDLILV